MYGIVAGENEASIWGMRSDERARIILERHKLADPDADPVATGDAALVAVNPDFIFEAALVKRIKQVDPVIVIADDGRPVAARARLSDRKALEDYMANAAPGDTPPASLPPAKTIAELGGIYQKALRKTSGDLVFPLDSVPARKIEWSLYIGAYKGVTDLFTKYAWPVPAYYITRFCRWAGLSPNFVTTVSLIFVLLATWLFWIGEFGLGVAAGWVMCILDTVDGKLARVTLRSSKWGEAYDHGIDLVHPPIWYAAWAVGLWNLGLMSEVMLYLHYGIIFVGYWLGRIAEGIFMLFSGGLEMWVWRRADSLFRLIVSRRNPNLAMLMVSLFFGRPDLGFLAVSAWTIGSMVYQGVRILWAAWWRAKGRSFDSWLVA